MIVFLSAAKDLNLRLTSILKRITGMPDYASYLTHLRECHPERTPPTEREFFEEYLKHRYESGPTRCC